MTEPRRRVELWLFVLMCTVYVGATRGHFVGTDEIAVYQMTRSLWERGDLSVGPINNTFAGRDGRYYSQYSVGQAVAALPLYGLGKTVRVQLEKHNADKWRGNFAGPGLGDEPSRWGGDVEIFFVNLFNCFTTALLCVIFLRLGRQLGASERVAVAAALLLGATSYVAPFASGFLRHSAEALFLLWTLQFLLEYSTDPKPRTLAMAGTTAALMMLFRYASIVAWPVLAAWVLLQLLRRQDANRPIAERARGVVIQSLPFAVPLFVGLLVHHWLAWVRFGSIWGAYNNEGFTTPLYRSLHGFLLSPGDSVLLFTPLLLLVPLTFSWLLRRNRGFAMLLIALAVTYLLFYAKYTAWHGLWSAMGPRYLVPFTALLMIPLAGWIQQRGMRAWLAVAPLALLGLLVQLIHFCINFAFLYHAQHYPDWRPPELFLFYPDASPIVTGFRALLDGSAEVDFWLLNVLRANGPGHLLVVLLPLLFIFLVSCWRLVRACEAGKRVGA